MLGKLATSSIMVMQFNLTSIIMVYFQFSIISVQGQEPNLELPESTQQIPEENVCNVKNTASLKEVEQGTSNSTRDSLKERESTHTKLEPVKGCSTEAGKS